MAIIENLKRQHKDMENIMKSIEEYIQNDQIVDNISNIIKGISHLSGILSIHLRQEDQYIYPNLINSKEENIKELVGYYINEMKEIADSFTLYKNQYNTSKKVLNYIDTFTNETRKIFSILRNRIEKEDTQLYKFLSKLDDSEFIKITLSKND